MGILLLLGICCCLDVYFSFLCASVAISYLPQRHREYREAFAKQKSGSLKKDCRFSFIRNRL